MIKDIFILLWVLIIPLTLLLRPFFGKNDQKTDLLPQKQDITFSRDDKIEIGEVAFRFLGILLVLPVCAFINYTEDNLSFSMTDALSFFLIAEIVAFDFMTIIFYFKQEVSFYKKILAFSFVFANLWTSTVWILQGKLSGLYFFSSMLCYPLLGLNRIISYYTKKGTSHV